MDLQSRKIEFIQEFLKLQSEEAISNFERLLKKEKQSSDQDFKPMSIEELHNRIEQSESDFDNDRYKSHSEIITKYQ